MTEKSYFHDGTFPGDAVLAPYDAATFSELLNTLTAPAGDGYIVTEQLGDFVVTAGAGRTVDIASGRAFMQGHWIQNSANVNLALSTNTSGYPRWDRIVLQVDKTTGVVSIVSIQGAPSSNPRVPETPPSEDTLFLPLARVYLPDSYAAVSAQYVHDERKYAVDQYQQNYYSTRNLFPNGQFVIFGSDTTPLNDAQALARDPMTNGWEKVGSGSALKGIDAFPTQRFGRAINSFYAAANDGWQITLLTSENYTDWFVLSMLIEVTSGEAEISFAGVTKYVPKTDGVLQLIIRVSTTGYQTLAITHQTTDDIFSFSDIRLANSYVIANEETSGPYLVMLNEYIQYNITGLTGSGTVTMNWADFGSTFDNDGPIAFREGLRVSPIVLLNAVDDGSAAGAPTAKVTLGPRVDLGGQTNSTIRCDIGVASQMHTFTEANDLLITYTAAGTMQLFPVLCGAILG